MYQEKVKNKSKKRPGKDYIKKISNEEKELIRTKSVTHFRVFFGFKSSGDWVWVSFFPPPTQNLRQTWNDAATRACVCVRARNRASDAVGSKMNLS